ncbi:MAG: rhodanese-like domain-containing protein [Pseudanabaenaceae cyanobacterium bins.39]|nr:rhodanese-like domain-containing protein [Pseudanabaenaceae cyanobacterium bins.39]
MPVSAALSTDTKTELTILESNIDRFLTNIPSGFFTVSSVESLKGILLDRPQTMIIDVREPSEYRSGHIPKAINIPIRTLSNHIQEIPRDRPVILYCSTGYRSAMGLMTLHLLGYENVRGFTPSYAGWRMAGEAIAKS